MPDYNPYDEMRQNVLPRVSIHPTAVVAPSATLGDRTAVGAFALIGDNVVTGADCIVGAYTELRADCRLGDRVRLGSKCLLANATVIGSDSHLSGNFTTCNKPDLKDPGTKRHAAIGARFKAGVRVTIMPGVVIGDGVEVGACSQVRHDIPDGEVWFGNPATKHR